MWPRKKFESQYTEQIRVSIEKQIFQIVFFAVDFAKNLMSCEESSLHMRFLFQDLSLW